MEYSKQKTIGLLIAPSSENNRGIIQGVLNYVRGKPAIRVDQRKALPHLPWNELAEWRGNGLIAMAHTEEYVRMVLEKGLPSVNVSSQVSDARLPSVHADDEEMGQMAAEELIATGLRQFAFVGEMAWPNHRNRCEGFRHALSRAGFTCTMINIRMTEWTHEGAEQIEVDMPSLATEIAALPTPVGIAAGNDLFAYSLAEACKLTGAQIPDDVSIIGNGNLRLVCDSTDPPLSSVAHGADRIGFEAAQLLDELMQGKSLSNGLHRQLPAKGVVQRRSTDFFAVDDPLILRALRFIRSQVGENLTTARLAHDLGVSRRQLSGQFRDVLGHSPGEEIRRARLSKAKLLLRDSDHSVEDVGYACGFENPSGFVRFFRNAMGITPGRYRRSHASHCDSESDDRS